MRLQPHCDPAQDKEIIYVKVQRGEVQNYIHI